jgi:uncharacterized protein YcbK (DUF882 family)
MEAIRRNETRQMPLNESAEPGCENSPISGGALLHRKLFLRLAVILLEIAAKADSGSTPTVPSDAAYQLHFYHVHTGERLDIVYRYGDRYDPEALVRINQFLRDYRTGDVREYDPRVFDLLHELATSLRRPDTDIDVVCAYRTLRTNEYLRTHGHGVAQHSLHMQAMAIDIRIPGVSTAKLRDAALALHRGGVGYYAASNFVHLDVGRVRRW